MRGELPAGWQSAALRDIAEIVGGVTKDAKKSGGTGFREVPYLRVANVQRGWLDLTEVKLIAASEADIQKLNLLPGDILLNEGGDRDKLGRGWIWQGQLPECIHQNHVFRARLLSREIDPVYVAHFTNSMAQSYFAEHGSQTTNLASISLTKLGSLPIRLPPAAEQTRIVEKLEELLSDLDAGVAELKAAQAKLQHYRQSLLKAAVEGSLTRAWREAHPAPAETGADLLARILRERRARWEAQQLAKFEAQGKAPPKGWQGKYEEPLGPDTTDLPALPAGWAWASVEQLATLLSGHTPKDAGDYATANAAVQWFKVSDMNRAGNEERLIAAQTAFDAATAESLGLKVAPAGTIVFPKRGGAIATNKKRRLGVAASYDLNMMGLLPLEAVADWLWWWFSGIDLGRLSDGSNVPQINNPDIAPLPVPLPPLMEQAAIIGILTEQRESLAVLEAATEALRNQSTAQRQNLLRAAFAGQLVPQDPADEPAAELLARIRAGRAAAGVGNRARRSRPAKEGS